MNVSILTPIYRRGDWEPVLQSIVAAQTYPIHEWLVCEEKASRREKDIAGLPRLRLDDGEAGCIFTDNRLTISQKLNLMLDAATGDLIVYMSSDDYYHPNYVASIVNLFLEDPTLQAVSLSSMWFYHLDSGTYYDFDTTGSYSAALAHRRMRLRYAPRKLTQGGEDRQFITQMQRRNCRYTETERYKDSMLVIVHGGNLSTTGKDVPMELDPRRKFLRSHVPNDLAFDFYCKRC